MPPDPASPLLGPSEQSNFDALMPVEEEYVKLARSMSDSTLHNNLRNFQRRTDDLDPHDLMSLAGCALVAARRRTP